MSNDNLHHKGDTVAKRAVAQACMDEGVGIDPRNVLDLCDEVDKHERESNFWRRGYDAQQKANDYYQERADRSARELGMLQESFYAVVKRLGDCERERSELERENERLRGLLYRAQVALADWVNTHAPELCDDDRVQEAHKRMADSGGTLAYIAALNENIQAALADSRDEAPEPETDTPKSTTPANAGDPNYGKCGRCGSGIEQVRWGYRCQRGCNDPEPEGQESHMDYDRSIHSNPDHYAWADFFLETWPNCGIDRDTIAGWFANAMMAKHDSMQAQESQPALREVTCPICHGTNEAPQSEQNWSERDPGPIAACRFCRGRKVFVCAGQPARVPEAVKKLADRMQAGMMEYPQLDWHTDSVLAAMQSCGNELRRTIKSVEEGEG